MKRFVSCFLITLLFSLSFVGVAFAREISVYRVYNDQTGEHLYTTDTNEVTTLIDSGWKDEKTAWISPSDGTGVYRLNNPAAKLHLYTADQNEIDFLTQPENGWEKDNNGGPLFFSDGEVPIYRLYTPVTGDHHLTTDENEYEVLGEGPDWNQENIAFYALEAGNDSSGYGIDPYANVPKHETLYMIVLEGKTGLVTHPTEGQLIDVYYTPDDGSNEEGYLGPIISTELVGTKYTGVQIGIFEPGTYTLEYKVPNATTVFKGSVHLSQADFDQCEKIQKPSGLMNLVYKEVPLSLITP